MNRPARKPEQAVGFGDATLPRGIAAADRACDLLGCPVVAERLVADTDGSILFVCARHGEDLVHASRPRAEDPPTPRRAWPGRRSPTLIRAPALMVAFRLLAGIGMLLWGLVLCAQSPGGSGGSPVGEFDGILTGAIGATLLLGLVRPRYR